ncbi:MAG: glycerol-3-phosphate 1-O-acyltransferase PlsY, partial [Longimicrobiales bacterium]
MSPWLLLLASYLLGAIPTSFLVARAARGIDLRQHGSGNLGATNAFRVLGWKAAAPIFLLDIAKGWLPVALFPLWDTSTAWTWALAYGAAAVIGHVFSIYVRFRGGKGVATGTGVFLALAPLAVLAGLVVWTDLVLATVFVSLSSLDAAIVLPVVVLLSHGAGRVLF